ncbi:MAG: GntR family transcriptional regulator [Pseudomonadales bacterium]|nr:GntR family transcriptional regulator [Pseudomonadales bacterium]
MRKLHADPGAFPFRSTPFSGGHSSNNKKNTNRRQSDMSFQAPDSLAEQIARHIGQLIITGELSSGDRIQELRIASELNVSRGSVREAYLILERRYLIEIIPRKGAIVSHMTPKHVENVYEMNILMLSLLIRKATHAWQEQDLAPFMELIQDMQKMVEREEYLEFLDATFNFARMGYQFADNTYLEDMLNDLQPSIRRTYYVAIKMQKDEMERSLSFFQNLMERLIARDAEGAVSALEKFGEHQCQTVLTYLEV